MPEASFARATNHDLSVSFSLRAGCLWVFLSRKIPENAEFAIAGAILDARENWSGAGDKAGGGEREKNRLPENPSSARRRIKMPRLPADEAF